MVLPLGFSEKIKTPFFNSAKRSLLLLELLSPAYIIYISGGNGIALSMAFILSFWNVILFNLSKYCDINLFPAGLPVSFIVILYFNAITSVNIAFIVYTLPLIFYTFFFIQSRLLRYSYIFIFMLGSFISQYAKLGNAETLLLFFIPVASITYVFMNSLKHLQQVHDQIFKQNIELNESKSSLIALVENVNSLIWCIDKNYNYLRGNLKFKKSNLLSLKDNIKQGDNLIEQLLIAEEKIFWKQLYDRGLKGDAFVSEIKIEKNNEITIWEYNISPIVTPNGLITGVTIMAKDITKKRNYEKLRKENEQLLNLIINKMPIGFELFDEKGLAIMMNEVQKQNLGILEISNVVGKYNVLKDPELKKNGMFEHFEKAYRSGEIVKFETERFCTNHKQSSEKRKRYFEILLFSIKNENNEIKGIIELAQEITNRKLNEMILLNQNKRMEEYTFTVSHVIRRPVANLISLTNLLDNTKELSEDDQLTLTHIHDSVLQLDNIIKELNQTITSINHNIYEH